MTGTPVVAADGVLVAVTLVVRFEPTPARPEEAGMPERARLASWRTEDEDVVRVLVVTALRLLAETTSSADLLSGRAEVVAAVDRMLALAPVAPRFLASTRQVELALGVPDVRDHAEFRVAG